MKPDIQQVIKQYKAARAALINADSALEAVNGLYKHAAAEQNTASTVLLKLLNLSDHIGTGQYAMIDRIVAAMEDV